MPAFRPKIIFSDFDGTLTSGEELSADFFDVLALVSNLGSELVIVTGRSVSWAHFLLTHFPLKAVISEGGGMISLKHKHVIEDTSMVRPSDEEKLEIIAQELPRCFLNVALTADSYGRRTDRAIDLHQLQDRQVRLQIEEYLVKEGANFSTSSVHLNFWLGDVSKAKATKEFLRRHRQGVEVEQCLFFGDGLNDQSMFEFIPQSVGVSNIAANLPAMRYRPALILKGRDHEGVKGVVNHLRTLLAQ